ncbi:major facilitator superfamily MFS_1 [Ferroglobus placidus DSM 10642]|uniref:Major facilitator superfamily MFS_1 n=1 Tax=Ferroglobus placidus (strain DSM 10642 / AEDII12DO) TaxID=589924 RepID=D3S2G5_FERPA|nr:MFS transporter [Ferroglobus placidus]ADC64495.1 major facilitator superfamily MFS_1 [Ferroglobus placidus DSM 10642]
MVSAEDLKKKYGLKGDPKEGLIAATLGFFVGFAAVALYGPTAKEFKDVMGLSGTLLGLLVAIPQLTGSLFRIPFGAWVDKVGGKKPMLTLLALSVIGMAGLTTLLILYYPHGLTMEMYPLILLFGALSGCGVATFSVGIPQTSYWFPQKRQGWALGTYAGLGNTAPGFFTLLIPFALAALGLPGAYSAWFLFLLAGTIVYAIIAHDAYYFQLVKKGVPRDEAIKIAKQLGQELFPSGKLVDALKISAKIGRTWALVALYFTSFGGFLALTTWFPTYWRLFHGFDIKTAGILGGVGFSLLASFIRVYGGYLSDKMGGERTAIMSYTLVLIGAGILTISTSFAPALIGEILIGAGMGIANAAVFKLVAKYVPEAVGGASGWVGGLGAFGGFVVPPILGAFVDAFGELGYARGFIVYVALALMSITISLILKKRYGHEIH